MVAGWVATAGIHRPTMARVGIEAGLADGFAPQPLPVDSQHPRARMGGACPAHRILSSRAAPGFDQSSGGPRLPQRDGDLKLGKPSSTISQFRVGSAAPGTFEPPRCPRPRGKYSRIPANASIPPSAPCRPSAPALILLRRKCHASHDASAPESTSPNRVNRWATLFSPHPGVLVAESPSSTEKPAASADNTVDGLAVLENSKPV